MITVTTDGGKYTFVLKPELGVIRVLRYGQLWHEWETSDAGFRAIASLIMDFWVLTDV